MRWNLVLHCKHYKYYKKKKSISVSDHNDGFLEVAMSVAPKLPERKLKPLVEAQNISERQTSTEYHKMKNNHICTMAQTNQKF